LAALSERHFPYVQGMVTALQAVDGAAREEVKAAFAMLAPVCEGVSVSTPCWQFCILDIPALR